MTHSQIREVQNAFRESTLRAVQAGYEWLELHFGHGYLAHSFLSPLSNKRIDEYGGSFDNRVRFTVETVRAVRRVWSDNLPLAVRLSSTDWTEDGWTLAETIELSRLLKSEGVDLIDCSSGFVTADISKIPFGAGFQVPLSEAVRREADIPTATVGFITNAAQADQIIRNGQADIVLLARKMLREPYWAIQAARELNQAEKLRLPIQYAHRI